MLTPTADLEAPINLTCMSLDCGWKDPAGSQADKLYIASIGFGGGAGGVLEFQPLHHCATHKKVLHLYFQMTINLHTQTDKECESYKQ